MDLDSGLNLCRICLSADEADCKLTSMFADDGEMAVMFQNLSGCGVSFDSEVKLLIFA